MMPNQSGFNLILQLGINQKSVKKSTFAFISGYFR